MEGMQLKREVQIPLAELYDEDETAWLEGMSRLISERCFHDLDIKHLSEFLSDMARRDKREVLSRLTTLLTHLLKWEHQPSHRTNSWAATIASQRDEFKDLLESKTLMNHAREVLEKAYARAVNQAALETGLAGETFAGECPLSLDEILNGNSA
jgi:hypothetical protein